MVCSVSILKIEADVSHNHRELTQASVKFLAELTAMRGTQITDEELLQTFPGEEDPLDDEWGWTLEKRDVTAIERNGAFFVVCSRLVRKEGETEKVGAFYAEHVVPGLEVVEPSEQAYAHDREVEAVWGGYASAEEVIADAKRALVKAVLQEPQLRSVLGFQQHAVMLVRGYLWLTITTGGGDIDVQMNEEPNPAYETYAHACQRLAGRIENGFVKVETADDVITPKVAAMLIRQESARMLAGQAEMSLTIALTGLRQLQGVLPKVNYSRLAVDLWTDTGILGRAEKRQIGN